MKNNTPRFKIKFKANAVESTSSHIKSDPVESQSPELDLLDIEGDADQTNGSISKSSALKPAKRKKAATDSSPRLSKRKKTSLSTCLGKLIAILQQKDTYGFFLAPVDQTLVTDYSAIVKNPMDLGTMKEKVDKRIYNNHIDFKNDFELVMKNAKLYNAKDTIYYKMADKLLQFGLKLFEREMVNVVPDSEMGGDMLEDIPSTDVKVILKFLKSVKEDESKRRSAKKIKHWEDLENMMFERMNGDGTNYIPEITEPIDNVDISQMEINDWNMPVIPNRIKHPRFAAADQLYFTYGDQQGKSYINSLESFTENMQIQSTYVNEITKRLTRGAHSIAKIVKKSVASKDLTSHGLIQAECGTVDIKKQIETCQSEFDDLIRSTEMEIYRKLALLSCSIIQKPITSLSENSNIIPSSQLLDQNLTDFRSLLENPNNPNKPQICELIRRRLVALVDNVGDPELEQRKAIAAKGFSNQQIFSNQGAMFNSYGQNLSNPLQNFRPPIIQNN
ncbi:Bromodomain containing protein 7 [Globomyces sp. JEL0801]|nr:Bromodomain containing protein 7 [Globomyces sp. JEL0801]